MINKTCFMNKCSIMFTLLAFVTGLRCASSEYDDMPVEQKEQQFRRVDLDGSYRAWKYVEKGSAPELADLLKQYPALPFVPIYCNRTLLHIATTFEIAEMLIKAGANVHAIDIYRNTSLHFAKTVAIAQLLLDAGADVDARNDHGQTRLYEVKTADITQLLLDAGANVHAIDIYGNTPLHFAKTVAIVQLLLDAGADVDARNDHGQTPLYYAARFNCKDVATVLLNWYAHVDTQTANYLNQNIPKWKNIEKHLNDALKLYLKHLMNAQNIPLALISSLIVPMVSTRLETVLEHIAESERQRGHRHTQRSRERAFTSFSNTKKPCDKEGN